MLMLTHTYLLQKVFGASDVKKDDLDIYVYNIVPDLLTIHPQISSAQTHKIKRNLNIPACYSRASYVMFHLLVDDLAHYGYICPDCKEEFDPDSQGYSYVKGKPLINSIFELYNNTIGKEISYNDAAYSSHLIIEMIFDLVILTHMNSIKTVDLLAEAINFTAKNKMDEFSATINWLYDLGGNEVKEVMKEASFYITKERMERIMNIDGRIRLYTNKFGLKTGDKVLYDGIKKLFLQARDLLDADDELFLFESAQTIKNYGWVPPLT
ncbi:MAG: hypothetical protein A2031_07560 [Deltaproteobacteria bacterium RBG_19FT_COMBO_43_11]|nr:MAG: hypothetical protein A2031_07560 [Deltaproteobacteria bacterium RBG_19FT_COMBO_43_11]